MSIYVGLAEVLICVFDSLVSLVSSLLGWKSVIHFNMYILQYILTRLHARLHGYTKCAVHQMKLETDT